jgi:Putative beta-barrel porin-2, OmpL-like. bbp2
VAAGSIPAPYQPVTNIDLKMSTKTGLLICSALFFTAVNICAQTDSLKSVTFSGYAEFYYSYDFSRPGNHEKPFFLYNHKRHNEVSLNLAYAKASYNKNNVRANIALMAGTYAQYNLSAEPTWAQFVYEANVGVKISKKHAVWLDAGIMPSHIGFESATGADCHTLSRSIAAENSPYYETGVKLSWISKNEKWNTAFLVLNGWQRIRKPDNIQKPSFGMQVTFKPHSRLTLNYSNFIGTDKPDSINATRLFHNLYAIFGPASKFELTAGFDIATDKYNSKKYGLWYSPVLIVRYAVNNKNRIAARLEYYNDPNQIIISTGTPNGFKTFGASLNYDFEVSRNVLWRSEVKNYHSADAVFNSKKTNLSLTTSISVKL